MVMTEGSVPLSRSSSENARLNLICINMCLCVRLLPNNNFLSSETETLIPPFPVRNEISHVIV
jgi:hypothetical protein